MFAVNTNLLDAMSQTWQKRPGVIVMDIDDTILDQTPRVEAFEQHQDVIQYQKDYHLDRAIVAGTVVCTALLRLPHTRPVFVCARPEGSRLHTQAQLEFLFDLRFDQYTLVMCDARYNLLDTAEFKVKALEDMGITPPQVIVAFDSRPSVVEAYRKLGITAYQTSKGF